jgi:hypothetical protein
MASRGLPTFGAMSDELSDASGVMLVRAWVHDGQIVARVQASRSGDEKYAVVAVGIDGVAETLTRWLEHLAATAR